MTTLRFALMLAGALAASACSDRKDTPAAQAPATHSATQPTNKDPAAARALIAQGAVVLDVRSPEEFADDHLPNAVNIPVDQVGTRVDDIAKLVDGDKSKPVVVHCGAGGRAAKAKAQLEAAGFTQVVNGGGLDDLAPAN